MQALRQKPASDHLYFKGRPGDPRLGEWVKRINDLSIHKSSDAVLFGCPDDTGVKLNRGRPGASEGPDAIRKYLYKMCLPMDLEREALLSLYDLGNIEVGNSITETHQRTFDLAKAIGSCSANAILLGGGHDFAAPGFLGYLTGYSSHKKNLRAALLNVDPHLDVRELENGLPHSGTPMRQILESKLVKGSSFIEFGTQPNRNARIYFEYCKKHRIRIVSLEEIRLNHSVAEFKKSLNGLCRNHDLVGVTIDMDSCRDAEGSSAAPVIGFSAWELVQFAFHAGQSKKVIYLEIAENSPPLDPQDRGSRIGAELIYSFLKAKIESSLKK